MILICEPGLYIKNTKSPNQAPGYDSPTRRPPFSPYRHRSTVACRGARQRRTPDAPGHPARRRVEVLRHESYLIYTACTMLFHVSTSTASQPHARFWGVNSQRARGPGRRLIGCWRWGRRDARPPRKGLLQRHPLAFGDELGILASHSCDIVLIRTPRQLPTGRNKERL
jgi:hypothetical protein